MHNIAHGAAAGLFPSAAACPSILYAGKEKGSQSAQKRARAVSWALDECKRENKEWYCQR
jgi:hypothetical protein